MHVDISITNTELTEAINQAVSRIAAGTYSEDGSSLYDGLKITSRDASVIEKIIDEALIILQSSLGRFVDYVEATTAGIEISLKISSRREKNKSEVILKLAKNAAEKLIVSKYFSEKQQEEFAKKFDELAAVDIKLLTQQIYHKAPPSF